MNADIRISALKKEYLPVIKYIWKKCFGDGDRFLEAYFNDVISPESGFGLFENGKLVSDLFMLPFKAKLSDAQVKAHFLAGCATLPEARNKDYMKTLIKYALNYFYEAGECATYLHPFKHSFYRKFGYETIAYVNYYSYSNKEKKTDTRVFVTDNFDEIPLKKMLFAYNEKMKEYDNCFIRDEKRFNAWIKLLCADGGKAAYALGEDNNVSFYALLYETEDNACDIFELIAADREQAKKFVNALPYEKINCFLPAAENFANGDNAEFTMMRVVNPKAALEKYPFGKKENFIIKVYDEFLEKDYNLLIKPGALETKVEAADGKPDMEVDVNRLAQLITGSYMPDVSASERHIFKRQTSCFFETY